MSTFLPNRRPYSLTLEIIEMTKTCILGAVFSFSFFCSPDLGIFPESRAFEGPSVNPMVSEQLCTISDSR